jgi:hypothetical protein
VNTPENITELRENEVFVFGSHASGHHAGGAARFAVERFGAKVGQGEGIQGQSYALPTMGSHDELVIAVGRFLFFANERRDLTFFVTKVGTGIAGLKVDEVAPLFKDRSPNVIVPLEFEAFA